MYKFFVEENQIKNNIITISKEDINHIKNVLRLNENEKIEVCEKNNGNSYICVIKNIQKDKIEVEILEKNIESKEANIYINIFQGIPKSEKMDLIIQKATELGVKEITPVIMERCIVKIDNKNFKNKIERWRKIALISSKQCKRDIVPKVNDIINIKNICNFIKNYDILLLAYENEKINTLKMELKKFKNQIKDKNINKKEIKIGVIIGPEGGIDKSEEELLKTLDIIPITLGKRILRTETTSIILTSIIMYELGAIE